MFLQASGHNIFINQSIHNIVLRVFLFKDILRYIVDSQTLKVHSAAIHASTKLISYIYFLFHLVLRSLKVLQLSFKQQNWYQKHKNAKTMTLHRTWKRYLFTLWELKQGRRVSVSLISAGNMSIGWLTFSLLHACLWMTMNVPWILILGLQIYLACSRIHKYTLRIMSTDCT